MAKIIGHIPARIGSQRVKKKNLRLLNGKPMIRYAIDAACGVALLDEVYINSDSEEIGTIAPDTRAEFYRRSPDLAGDESTLDEFTYDIMVKLNPEILVMVNPVCPLLTSVDVEKLVTEFLESGCDTMITTNEIKLHSFCAGVPVNFDPEGQLPKTQNLPPLQVCVWAVTAWKTSTFIVHFEKYGHAVFSGKRFFPAIPAAKSVKVSTEEDFFLAEAFLRARG